MALKTLLLVMGDGENGAKDCRILLPGISASGVAVLRHLFALRFHCFTNGLRNRKTDLVFCGLILYLLSYDA